MAALSALFIFINSLVALVGRMSAAPQLPSALPWMVLSAMAGGAIGAQLGSLLFPDGVVRRVLAITLLIGGLRLFSA